MRIISPYRDYYDCMQGYDGDKQDIYHRNPEALLFERTKEWIGVDNKVKQWPFPYAYSTSAFDRGAIIYLNVINHIVGFCGNIYPVLEMSWSNWNDMSKTTQEPTFCHNLESVDKFMYTHGSSKDIDFFQEGHIQRGHRRYKRSFSLFTDLQDGCRKKYEGFFSACAEKKSAFAKKMEDKRCPVFLATLGDHTAEHSLGADNTHRSHGYITWNACLKDVEFYRVFGPQQAYQEIVMFRNNIAVPMKPIPQLDDETMAESKGFDRKFSFRKDPIRKRK